ncbi:MAG: acylphosphatase [Gallionella sp.]
MNTPRIIKHLVIHGLVQGVCFRDSMRREALRLQVNGWVRNRPDGTVEALVQGNSESVDAIVAWAHRGPLHAQVARVDIGMGSGNHDRFEVVG